MKTTFILVFMFFIYFKMYAQSYFDDIVKMHFVYYYSIDSITMNDMEVPVFRDSLAILNENKQIINKYWEIDSSGHIVNIYFEVSKNSLFVIRELDLETREYFLYEKKGTKKVKLIKWFESDFKKRKEILIKPNHKKIQYYKDGLVF